MDNFLVITNGVVCALIAFVLVWAVMSTRIHDGIVIKCGMVSMVLGFGSVAVQMLSGLLSPVGLARAILLINIGLSVAVAGYAFRRSNGKRLTDWSDL